MHHTINSKVFVQKSRDHEKGIIKAHPSLFSTNLVMNYSYEP